MSRRSLTLMMISLLFAGCAPEDEPPAVCGHAHNDYLHARPLHDALDRGFCSIEADVHAVGGKLLVAHHADEVDATKTLESLYLAPLRERIERGQIGDDEQITLLIDFKTDAEPTYRALEPLLARYESLLTRFDGERELRGPLVVVLSGKAPEAQLSAQATRLAALDGRLWNLDRPRAAMRWISANWQLHFGWRGEGPLPAKERRRLRDLVDKTHAIGRLVRFWNTPETTAAWRELYAAGVDLINTDDLDGFTRWRAAL